MLRRGRFLLNTLTPDKALKIFNLTLAHSFTDVKKEYKRMVVVLHPDATLNLDPTEREKKEEQFKEVTVAYAYLEEIGVWKEGELGASMEEGGGGWNHSRFSGENWWDEGVLSEKWKQKQLKRIRFTVDQLEKTNRVQHIPLPFKDVDLHLVSEWLLAELESRDLHGYNIRASAAGPFGVPCLTITGIPQHLFEAKQPDPKPGFSFAKTFRKFIVYMRSEV